MRWPDDRIDISYLTGKGWLDYLWFEETLLCPRSLRICCYGFCRLKVNCDSTVYEECEICGKKVRTNLTEPEWYYFFENRLYYNPVK